MIERRKAKTVKVGNVALGGNNRIAVQSMLNVPAHDVDGNVKQAIELENAGCEIIRLTVPDTAAAKTLYAVKENVNIPVVADIHFDYRCALESVAAGADKIRINPGNIGDDSKVKAVADACKLHGVPIRIGVNSGSLEKNILAKYGSPTPEALCESASYHISLLEKFDFNDIVVSIKSSDVQKMVTSYRMLAKKCDYPLHLGVTEAGTHNMALVKSSIGIGSLLLDGIGDTIRVSMTDNPVKEVKAGFDILKAAGIKTDCVRLVSCPTCGRTKIDLISLAKEIEDALANCNKQITVAVMGCVVNGPGEAKEADIGVAGGDGCGVIFKRGEVLKKVNEDEIVTELLKEAR